MKEKSVKKIEINISNKIFYSIVLVLAIILLGVGVYAITPGVAPNPGHLISEVAPPSGCASGILYFTGSSWYCTTNLPSCTGTNKLLQYDSFTNAWSCASFSDSTPYECYWTGYSPNPDPSCLYTSQITRCPDGNTPTQTTQVLCYGGSISSSRTVWICPAGTDGTCSGALQ